MQSPATGHIGSYTRVLNCEQDVSELSFESLQGLLRSQPPIEVVNSSRRLERGRIPTKHACMRSEPLETLKRTRACRLYLLYDWMLTDVRQETTV
jgi:hypothetical protein